MDLHCWNMGEDNPWSDYGAAAYDSYKQAIIDQQRLIFNMIILYIKNSLTTDAKRKLGAYKTSYAYRRKYYRAAMLFVIWKMAHPNTCASWSDIKKNMETMKLSKFKNDTPN